MDGVNTEAAAMAPNKESLSPRETKLVTGVRARVMKLFTDAKLSLDLGKPANETVTLTKLEDGVDGIAQILNVPGANGQPHIQADIRTPEGAAQFIGNSLPSKFPKANENSKYMLIGHTVSPTSNDDYMRIEVVQDGRLPKIAISVGSLQNLTPVALDALTDEQKAGMKKAFGIVI